MGLTLENARKKWKTENDALVKKVKIILALSTLTQETLGEKIGISGKTLRSRMKDPSTFKRCEQQAIEYLAEVYGIN